MILVWVGVADDSLLADKEVPNLDGLTVDEARERLRGTGLGVEPFGTWPVEPGSGRVDVIVRQSPTPGELVPEGTAILIWIGEEGPDAAPSAATTTSTTESPQPDPEPEPNPVDTTTAPPAPPPDPAPVSTTTTPATTTTTTTTTLAPVPPTISGGLSPTTIRETWITYGNEVCKAGARTATVTATASHPNGIERVNIAWSGALSGQSSMSSAGGNSWTFSFGPYPEGTVGGSSTIEIEIWPVPYNYTGSVPSRFAYLTILPCEPPLEGG